MYPYWYTLFMGNKTNFRTELSNSQTYQLQTSIRSTIEIIW